MLHQSRTTAARVAVALLVLLFGACGSSDGQRQVVPLRDSSDLRVECQAAADQLGYQVPCPMRLPTVDGETPACRSRCVAQAGGDETLDTIFVLNVENFDADLSAGQTRHLVIEARRIDRAPAQPCAGATNRHRVKIGDVNSTQVTCPTDSPDLATITHGEGIHQGHTLLYWDQADVQVVISVHGHDAPMPARLAELAKSTVLVAPTQWPFTPAGAQRRGGRRRLPACRCWQARVA